jgi:hypothetical protein
MAEPTIQLKALTVWQPWASLIIIGAKTYEFRGWPAPKWLVDQQLVIHAAARKVDWREVWQLVRLLEAGGRYAAQTCLHPEIALPFLKACQQQPDLLPLAAGLGTARVGAARNGLQIAAEFGVSRANDSDREAHANWGWPMRDIERWETPVPMKGMQGLWNWPDATNFMEGLS